MRRLVTVFLGIGLIGIGGFIAYSLANTEKPQRPTNEKVIPTAFTTRVENSTVPIVVVETGRLRASNRIELFTEVQGVMEQTRKELKPGTEYRKGETLVHIRSDEFNANLQAQKSTLQNMITAILPDLRLDFPEAYPKWDAYVRNFDMNKPVKPLPEPSSEKEKFFVTGKNIYTTYYSTKNMEIILSKYTLRAPYDGIIIDGMVTPGTLVRQGQKLGEFIDPTLFELEVAVSKSLIDALRIGQEVRIGDPDDSSKEWFGTIKRINGMVDVSTQTVLVFIELRGKDLKEGMFLQAEIQGKQIENAIEIQRNLIVDGDKVYVVTDEDVLQLVPVEPMFYYQKTVVVRGLPEGATLLSKPVPGSYSGMEVQKFDAPAL